MNGQETSLKGLFQSLIPDAEGIFQATVISVSPLKVQAINDAKLIIPESLLIVPPRFSDDYVFEAEFATPSYSTDFVPCKMIIKNALKVGDKVHLYSFDKGNKYYVLDRVD